MPSFSGKNQNDWIRTEGGVAISSKSKFLEFLEFQPEILNSGFVTGRHYMPSFSSKKFRMIEYEPKEE